MAYIVSVNQLVSGNPMRYENSVLGEFATYDQAVAFCKKELDILAHRVNTWQDSNPMAKEYDPNDAFSNGGGDMRITPEPPAGVDRFSADKYFYDKV